MNAEDSFAFRTFPSYFFIRNKFSYPIFLNIDKVLNHAHPISGSVSLIQLLHPFTWELVARETESRRFQIHTLSNSALRMMSLVRILIITPWTSVLLSLMAQTDRTIHPTWSD